MSKEPGRSQALRPQDEAHIFASLGTERHQRLERPRTAEAAGRAMSWVGFRRAGPILVAVLRLHWLLPRVGGLYAKGRYARGARRGEKACDIARRQFGEVD